MLPHRKIRQSRFFYSKYEKTEQIFLFPCFFFKKLFLYSVFTPPLLGAYGPQGAIIDPWFTADNRSRACSNGRLDSTSSSNNSNKSKIITVIFEKEVLISYPK